MEFKEKVVLVTGSGSGIGEATAVSFANAGADLIVSDINEEAGNETVNQIKQAGGNAIFIKADVSNYEEVKALIQESVETFGQLDIAVNNAGIGGNGTHKTAETELDDWDKVIAVNQSGVFYCMKEELKVMFAEKSGCIINIASIAGLRAMSNASPYVASKHAVVGMTKTAATEYAKHGIRVNALCPVFTPTNLFQPEFYGPLADKLKARIPMKRWADKQEMANAILWLASGKASFVTGHAFPVDGGLMA